jgi:hypothetical protein
MMLPASSPTPGRPGVRICHAEVHIAEDSALYWVPLDEATVQSLAKGIVPEGFAAQMMQLGQSWKPPMGQRRLALDETQTAVE